MTGDRQSESESGLGAGVACSHLFEGSEDAFSIGIREPGSVVAHHDLPLVAEWDRFDRHRVATVLAGVFDEVAKDLLDPVGVGMDYHVASDRDRRRSCPGLREDPVDDLEGRRSESKVGRIHKEFSCLESGDGQHIVDEVLQVL